MAVGLLRSPSGAAPQWPARGTGPEDDHSRRRAARAQFAARFCVLYGHAVSGRISGRRVHHASRYLDQNGRPSGPPKDFLTGWMVAPANRDVWGRPVGVITLADGSLLVSDDGGKKIWRVSYGGGRGQTAAVSR